MSGNYIRMTGNFQAPNRNTNGKQGIVIGLQSTKTIGQSDKTTDEKVIYLFLNSSF